MADAKKHLSVIPTEYDEDGPMPPIQEALLNINSAKEASISLNLNSCQVDTGPAAIALRPLMLHLPRL